MTGELCSMCEIEPAAVFEDWPGPVCEGCDRWLKKLDGDLKQLEAEDPDVAQAARNLEESYQRWYSQRHGGSDG